MKPLWPITELAPLLWQAPREALAQTVLAEVPTQLVSYFRAQGWAPFKPPPPAAKGPAQAPQA